MGPEKSLEVDGTVYVLTELWETKFLAYLRLLNLKSTIRSEPPGEASEGAVDDAAKNEDAYAELIQLLDDKSLSLVMRDAADDGRKALKILREHYAGRQCDEDIAQFKDFNSFEPHKHVLELADGERISGIALKKGNDVPGSNGQNRLVHRNGVTFYIQLSAQHPSASTLVLEAGINNLKFQQSEVLKQDFIFLVDRLLDTGKRLIISGPLPPPRYGDVVTSRLRQLHLWLKGYCLGNSIPFVDNFAAFLNRPHLFKRDGLHPNHEGSRLLSLNIDLTVRSCATSTS
ncbi:hypothetical protein D4764_14G0004170 [Takifugu flavidus]|uniref:SGNH hydrolase-type esterase domain-containing protein n=1 Tax=Takifugu flavidus TaxID=433684 RepID=A0A5C6P3K9_9TELE|nr:hypothetical protein D4764_14G0004170 [Takifugu flavidus]